MVAKCAPGKQGGKGTERDVNGHWKSGFPGRGESLGYEDMILGKRKKGEIRLQKGGRPSIEVKGGGGERGSKKLDQPGELFQGGEKSFLVRISGEGGREAFLRERKTFRYLGGEVIY